tara:strand:+ start:5840 stop:6172 length:333 start_codon:yes stop_codon:yes gene_type:complete
MVLYGIKNCDTVKKARKYLDGLGVEYSYHDFRVDGLTQAKVSDWVEAVGMDVLINRRSATWKGLTDAQKANVTVDILCEYPTLIKRPVLETPVKIVVGYLEAEYGEVVSS